MLKRCLGHACLFLSYYHQSESAPAVCAALAKCVATRIKICNCAEVFTISARIFKFILQPIADMQTRHVTHKLSESLSRLRWLTRPGPCIQAKVHARTLGWNHKLLFQLWKPPKKCLFYSHIRIFQKKKSVYLTLCSPCKNWSGLP